mmetsp:Transcript_43554/g.125925  ORF Transcript_43554/g.125925 Transcript_43554/m.125925 type:complete len:213 (-) Transcript_43554:371-1009(-)
MSPVCLRAAAPGAGSGAVKLAATSPGCVETCSVHQVSGRAAKLFCIHFSSSSATPRTSQLFNLLGSSAGPPRWRKRSMKPLHSMGGSSRSPVCTGHQQLLLRRLVGEFGGGHGAVTSNSNSAPKTTPVTQRGQSVGAGVKQHSSAMSGRSRASTIGTRQMNVPPCSPTRRCKVSSNELVLSFSPNTTRGRPGCSSTSAPGMHMRNFFSGARR